MGTTGGRWRIRAWGTLARAFVRAAAPHAASRAAPAVVVLGVVSAVAFGGNGLRPRDLVVALGASTGALLGAGLAWIAIVTPAARACARPPSTEALRSLPAPRALLALVLAVELVVLQAPVALLVALGASRGAAAAVALTAATVTALVIAPPRRPAEIAAAALLAATIVAGAPLPVVGGVAALTSPLAFLSAARRGAEPTAGSATRRLPRSGAVALALAELAVLARRDRHALARGAAVCVLAAGALALSLRSVEPDARARLATVAVGAPLPLALAVGGVGGRVLETERRLEWLLRSLGASARLRGWSAVGATSVVGALAGALLGGAALLFDGAGALAVASGSALVAIVGGYVGMASATGARLAQRAAHGDGPTLVVATLAGAASALALLAVGGPEAALSLPFAALALGSLTPRWLARREHATEWATRTTSLP